MGVNTVHVKHSIKYHPTGVSAVILGGLRRKTCKLDNEVLSDVSDAELYPDHLSTSGVKVGMEFSTVNIAAYMATLGLSASCITSGANPGLVSYWQKRGCAGPAAGSVHRSYTYQNGIIVPVSLNVRHRSPAELSYMFKHTGATAPVKADTEALPTIPTSSSQRFDLYAMRLAGVDITGMLDVGISFNSQLYELGSDSEITDSFAGLKSQQPVITIRNFALAALGTVDLDGIACAHADSWIILKKRNTATTTAEHIRLTFQGLCSMETLADANGLEPAEETLVVRTARDNTNGPFVSSYTYAIA